MARLAVRRLRLRYPMTARSALAQGRPVADQAGLGARGPPGESGRRFPAAAADLSAAAVVLVDDLVTTGSSLTEAARVLGEARIPVLGAATVAATVRLQTRMFAD